jgi:hypothetical protein
MIYDERLIGKKPSDAFVARSRARLSVMFEQRFKDRQVQRKERRLVEHASFEVLRGLAKNDPKLAAAVANGKKHSAAHARRRLKAPKRSKVLPRQRLGSISVTFVPPFWPWKWTATTGSASATANADGTGGSMNFEAYTGDDGKTASAAAALGYYFQPPGDNGILDVTANPSYSWDWETWTVFDSANAGNFIGLYVGEYTLGGEFVQAVIDQQIAFGTYKSSGVPLWASTPVDSDHFYEIWVWTGGDAEADGWSEFWGSAAVSRGSVSVPSISLYYYD